MKLTASHPNRIFIVGPTGVGKTTIGNMLAKKLGLAFADCDQEIERRSGADIPWIFEKEGEAGFRQRESIVVDDLTQRDDTVVATGGGAVLVPENRRHLIARGVVIHLDTDLDQLVQRTIKDKQRPLLQNDDPRGTLKRLKKDRDPLYREVSDIHVFIAANNSHKALDQILHKLKEAGFTE